KEFNKRVQFSCHIKIRRDVQLCFGKSFYKNYPLVMELFQTAAVEFFQAENNCRLLRISMSGDRLAGWVRMLHPQYYRHSARDHPCSAAIFLKQVWQPVAMAKNLYRQY